MASRKRIVICYILLQASFWGMLSSICAYQAAVVLDRGFTAGQAGIFCALCYFASLFTQPVIGGWADRHPEVPLKRLLIVMLLPAIALNLVFYFTRPNFLLTALTFFLFGVLETNSYPLIDSMGMQYVNAGVQIPYSLSRGIGSLSYALLCVATGLLTARFGMQTALLAHCAEQLVMLVCLLLFPSIPAQLLPQPQKGAASGHSALQILRGSRTFTLMLIACFFGMMGVMPISGFLVKLVTRRGGARRLHGGLRGGLARRLRLRGRRGAGGLHLPRLTQHVHRRVAEDARSRQHDHPGRGYGGKPHADGRGAGTAQTGRQAEGGHALLMPHVRHGSRNGGGDDGEKRRGRGHYGAHAERQAEYRHENRAAADSQHARENTDSDAHKGGYHERSEDVHGRACQSLPRSTICPRPSLTETALHAR